MNEIVMILYNLLTASLFTLLQIALVVCYVIACIRYKISGQKTAKVGFGLFLLVILAILTGFSDFATIAAQYVFLLFCIAFIQEFIHFLKHEQN